MPLLFYAPIDDQPPYLASTSAAFSGVTTSVPRVTFSGSGKRTLVYLLDLLYELPEENGKITVGGTDIRKIRLDHLRKTVLRPSDSD